MIYQDKSRYILKLMNKSLPTPRKSLKRKQNAMMQKKKAKIKYTSQYVFDVENYKLTAINVLMSILAFNRANGLPLCWPFVRNPETEQYYDKAIEVFSGPWQLYRKFYYCKNKYVKGFKGDQNNPHSIGSVVIQFNNLLMIFNLTKQGTLYQQITRQLPLVEHYFSKAIYSQLMNKFHEKKVRDTNIELMTACNEANKLAKRLEISLNKQEHLERSLECCQKDAAMKTECLNERIRSLCDDIDKMCEKAMQRRIETDQLLSSIDKLQNESVMLRKKITSQSEQHEVKVQRLTQNNDWLVVRNDSLEAKVKQWERWYYG